jgi:hypothetical protein
MEQTITNQTPQIETELKQPEREEAHEEGEKQPKEVIEYAQEELLETAILKDVGRGIEIELKSRIIPIDKLTSLAVNSFHWLQSQRTIKTIPSYLG